MSAYRSERKQQSTHDPYYEKKLQEAIALVRGGKSIRQAAIEIGVYH